MDSETKAKMLAVRQTLGASQTQMAKALGVNVRTYRRWENGEYPMPETAKLLLARLAEEV